MWKNVRVQGSLFDQKLIVISMRPNKRMVDYQTKSGTQFFPENNQSLESRHLSWVNLIEIKSEEGLSEESYFIKWNPWWRTFKCWQNTMFIPWERMQSILVELSCMAKGKADNTSKSMLISTFGARGLEKQSSAKNKFSNKSWRKWSIADWWDVQGWFNRTCCIAMWASPNVWDKSILI